MPRASWFWVVLIANVILLALWLWSRGGARMDVRIEAGGDEYRAFVDGRLVSSGSLEERSQGGVGFTFTREANIPTLPGPTGIDSVRVTDLDSGDVLFEDDFDGGADEQWVVGQGRWNVRDGVFAPDGRRGAVTAGDETWRNYVLEATLRNPAEVTVHFRDEGPGDTASLALEPFQQYRSTFSLMDNGQSVTQRGGSRLTFDRVETVRSMFAMLLRPYPLGVLMALGVAAIALAIRAAAIERPLWLAGRAVGTVGLPLAGVLALWALMLLWYANYVLGDAVPHVPDSVAYVYQSRIFASFHATASEPPAFQSFSHFHPPMFEIVDGRWFSQYPFGHPLLLSLGQVVHAPWLVPPLAGALSALLIFGIGKRVYGVFAGLVATVLLVFSPFFQMTASNFMSHNTAAFALLGCLFFYTRPMARAPLAMFVAGLCLGLAFNIRPLTAVALMPPLAAFMAYELWRSGDRRRTLIEGLAFGAGGVVMLLAYFGYNLLTTGEAATSPYALQGTFSEDTFGFSGAHSVATGLQNQQVHLALLLLVANGWPAAIGLVFAILPFVLGTRHRWDYFLLAAFIAVAGSQIFYVRAPIMHGPRFWYEALPFLILLSARGVQLLIEAGSALGDGAARRLAFRPEVPTLGVAGTAVLALVAGLIGFSTYSWMLERNDAWSGVRFTPQRLSMLEGFNFTDDRLLDAADTQDLDDALVFVEPCPQWWCYGSVFWANNAGRDGDVVWVEQQLNNDDLIVLEQYPEREVYVANYDDRTIVPVTRAEVEEAAELVITQPAASSPATRDAIRRRDLGFLRSAVERTRSRLGAYPDTGNEVQTLCVVPGRDAGCGVMEIISQVPVDPLGRPSENGYWYASDGERYVFVAQLESESQSEGDCPDLVLRWAQGEPRMCVTGGGAAP
jgi:hypothetical protein